MGISKDAVCLFDNRSGCVKKYTAQAVSRWATSTFTYFPLRSVDLRSKEIILISATGAVRSGIKDMFTLITDDGYKIYISDDAELLTERGWVHVRDLEPREIIWTNGLGIKVYYGSETAKIETTDLKTGVKTLSDSYSHPGKPYMSKDLMNEMYIKRELSQKEIAELLGSTERTIRDWIRKLNLHRGDAGALFGEDNPNWKGDNISVKGGYERTYALLYKEGLLKGICELCGTDAHDVHHIDHDPTNIDPSNLIELCTKCHRVEHTGMTVRHCKRSLIVDMISAGKGDTYDIKTNEMPYVANGYIIKGV